MATRTSTAQWEGDLKSGKGTMTVGKGAYTGPFTFGCDEPIAFIEP